MATVTAMGGGVLRPFGESDLDAVSVRSLPAVMSPAQLGEELDVSVRTLERWRESGNGPVYRNPAGTRFYRYYGTDVAAWLENKKPGAGTPGQNN